jgi:hypothetical protein
LSGAASIAAARKLAGGDDSERVRHAALLSLARLAPISAAENVALVARLAASDPDGDVRTLAAVLLGERKLSAGVDALVACLNGTDWGLAAVAAVSLGRTQTHEAVTRLAAIARTHADWKLRAAAIVGLSQAYDTQSIPVAIAALSDADTWVARCAWAHLVDVAGQDLGQKPESWTTWWAANEKTLILADPVAVAERRRRFSDSGTSVSEVFRELDVLVVESRGDHIEKVLASQDIAHRMTRAGALPQAALSQGSLLMMNCSGEIETQDVERVRWFVLTGGHLFGTCWALHETIVRAMPEAPVRRFATSGEVLDSVPASPVDRSSPYLESVFPPGVEPIYALEGAHLIEVLDPERVEVVVDSPWTAAKYGCGNLAAWFELGHGTVLDSVNHFDLQGLELAQGLKTARDRQAHAVDHMGLTYGALRASRDEKYWDKVSQASQNVLDLSVFRLLVNFVRMRRAELTRS